MGRTHGLACQTQLGRLAHELPSLPWRGQCWHLEQQPARFTSKDPHSSPSVISPVSMAGDSGHVGDSHGSFFTSLSNPLALIPRVTIVGRGTHETPVVEGVTHARSTACPWLSARDPRYGSSTLACCGRRKTAYNRSVALGNEGSSAHTKLHLATHTEERCKPMGRDSCSLYVHRSEVRQPWPELPQPTLSLPACRRGS